MAKQSDLGRKIAWVESEIERLHKMLEFLLADQAPSAETAPKRERKKRAARTEQPIVVHRRSQPASVSDSEI